MRLKAIFGATALVLLLGLSYLLSLSPRTDRIWDVEVARTATANVAPDGTITLRNVRDFTYTLGTTTGMDWIPEVGIRPTDIVRVWFMLEPFAEWNAVGHTYLTFELSDGSAYSFSVEARREAGESYSALKGQFRAYELAYVWGTERDFLTRRLLYLEHPVRMYPLSVDAAGAQALFAGLVERTNNLAAHPRFYNTLMANCTNVLAELANGIAPGTIPYDLSWNLPGYSDRFLMRIGLISMDGTIEATQAAHDLSPYRERINELANAPYALFGGEIRSLLSR